MELVKLEKNQPMTTSRIIAEGVEKDHHSIITLIRRYVNDLNEFGTLEFKVQKSGGRPLEYALLNEEQTTFLITLMRNNKKVIQFKKQLTKGFFKLKKTLANIQIRQGNEEWKQLRENGKLSRKEETDIIKEFVDYAIIQGSKNASKYYMIISKMENGALFLLQEKFPNIRGVLSGQQLSVISSADQIIKHALSDGMKENLHYKDIYKMSKERIETFSSVIPKSIVPMIEKTELIK